MNLLQGDSCKQSLIAYEINAQGWQKRLGLEGVGGVEGGCILKIVIAEGGLIFICNYLGGGVKKVLTHYFFLNPPPPTPRLVPKTNKVFPKIIV